jgi:hypothetical protein
MATIDKFESVVWENFSLGFPHELYLDHPLRFVTYVQTRNPGITIEQIEQILRETLE